MSIKDVACNGPGTVQLGARVAESCVFPARPDLMRIAILGGGTIARLFLEHICRGDLGAGIEVVAICGRTSKSRGAELAAEFGVPFVSGVSALVASAPKVVIEAASHEAVREHLVNLL